MQSVHLCNNHIHIPLLFLLNLFRVNNKNKTKQKKTPVGAVHLSDSEFLALPTIDKMTRHDWLDGWAWVYKPVYIRQAGAPFVPFPSSLLRMDILALFH